MLKFNKIQKKPINEASQIFNDCTKNPEAQHADLQMKTLHMPCQNLQVLHHYLRFQCQTLNNEHDRHNDACLYMYCIGRRICCKLTTNNTLPTDEWVRKAFTRTKQDHCGLWIWKGWQVAGNYVYGSYIK